MKDEQANLRPPLGTEEPSSSDLNRLSPVKEGSTPFVLWGDLKSRFRKASLFPPIGEPKSGAEFRTGENQWLKLVAPLSKAQSWIALAI